MWVCARAAIAQAPPVAEPAPLSPADREPTPPLEASATKPALPPATPAREEDTPPETVERVGDARWSSVLGLVGEEASDADPAPPSPVLDVPERAGIAPELEALKPAKNAAGYLGFATMQERPVNFGVEDELIGFTSYGLVCGMGFLFPTGRWTALTLDSEVRLTFGGGDIGKGRLSDEPAAVKSGQTDGVVRLGVDLRAIDQGDIQLRLGPRAGVMLALADVSAPPLVESKDTSMAVAFGYDFGLEGYARFESVYVRPRWRRASRSYVAAHSIGADLGILLAESFALWARYETRFGARGGFKYSIDEQAGAVDSLGQAYLQSLPDQTTLVIGIGF